MANLQSALIINDDDKQIEDIIDARKKIGQYDIYRFPANPITSQNSLCLNIYSTPATAINEEGRQVFAEDATLWINEGDICNYSGEPGIFSVGPTESEITVVRVKREGLQYKSDENKWNLHDDAVPGDGTHLGESPSLVNLVTLVGQSLGSNKTYEYNEYLVPLSSWDPCDNPTSESGGKNYEFSAQALYEKIEDFCGGNTGRSTGGAIEVIRAEEIQNKAGCLILSLSQIVLLFVGYLHLINDTMNNRELFMHSNGTTAFETFAVILPSFFFSFIVCTFNYKYEKNVLYIKQFLIEFTSIVVPIILNVTVLAQHINALLISLFVITVSTCVAFKREINETHEHPKKTPNKKKINFITFSRSTINLISVIGILAVDFKIFPRKFAKTLTYGFSLMDVGVGLYVFSNGIIAPEIRGHKNSFLKTIKSTIPLIVIGGARFLLTKEIDYHVPVSEYGVHWNFFITLAVTKILSSLILNFISVKNAIFSGISLLLAHEIILQLGLAKYVFSDVQRNNFFAANREGIVSALGYVALYYLSIAFGNFITVQHDTTRSKWKLVFKLCAISCFLLWATLILEKNFGVSRRLANSGYCIWVMFIGVSMTNLFYLGELVRGHICGETSFKVPLIFEAINYNGLVFFLLANIVTGIINILLDTLTVTSIWSFVILVLYMLLNCSIVSALFFKNIKIKL